MADQADQIQQAITVAIRAEMGDLRRFVDRRIAELSAEVHGTTQLLDFSESNLSSQLARLHEQVAHMVAAPGGISTRNSGIELEAVVQTTEAAANQIMEAAEAISDCVRRAMPDSSAMTAISAKIDAIFEACAFQDITGQRVRRAIEHLQSLETTLTGIMPSEDVHPAPSAAAAGPIKNPDLEQAAIDALLDM